MNVTIVSQCYLPDVTGNAAYAHGLAAALQVRGHCVTVLASRHRYHAGGSPFAARERIGDVAVVRLPGGGMGTATLLGRITDYVGFFLHAARRIASGPPSDLVIAITTPPFIGLVARWAARWRGARVVHWVLDCYPDAIAAALGPVRSRVLPIRLTLAMLGLLSRIQWGRGARVLTLGPRIAERLTPYRGRAPAWVPLWAEAGIAPWPSAAAAPALRVERGWEHERMVLCYSGNLGRGHRWNDFAAAADRLGAQGPLWVFVGSGNRRSHLARWHEQHPHARMAFLPYAPHQRLREHLCSPDVHLISMEPGWEGCIVPSKLQNAFAVGRPVLAVVPETSETARWIRTSGGGWVVAPGDVEGLMAAVIAAGDAGERARRGELASRFATRHFSATVNLDRIMRYLERQRSMPVHIPPTLHLPVGQIRASA